MTMTLDKNKVKEMLLKLKTFRTEGYLLMPTISTDIETAGVDVQNDTMLEFAAVFDNGKQDTKKEDMPFVNYKIWSPTICGNPYAIGSMPHNLQIIQEMAVLKEWDVLKQCCVLDEKGNPKKDKYGNFIAKPLNEYRKGWVTVDILAQLLNEFFTDCKKDFDAYYEVKKERPQGVTFQGKNFANFDLPFIKRTLLNVNDWKMNNFLTKGIKHRILDVGSLWADSFTFMPSLDDVNKVMERSEVTHEALDDVFDCVMSVRAKLLYQKELEDAFLESLK